MEKNNMFRRQRFCKKLFPLSECLRVYVGKQHVEVGEMGKSTGKGQYEGEPSLAFRDVKDINAPWRSVLSLARQSRRAKGAQVQQGKELLFLERGKLRLTYQNQDGAEKILWYIREGCLFGEAPFFDPMPNEGFFTCVTDCLIYTFSAQAVAQISKERPDLLLNLLQSMSRKLRIMSYHASTLYLDDMLVRICKFLAQRLVPDSNPLTAKIGISRQEMASLLGMHRISLYRVLRQQEEYGLFGPIKGNTMTILRPHEFYKLAEK
jgi:CRP-like cAMP-binding protein